MEGTCLPLPPDAASPPLTNTWELVDGRYRPHSTCSSKALPAPSPAEASEEDESNYDDEKDDDV